MSSGTIIQMRVTSPLGVNDEPVTLKADLFFAKRWMAKAWLDDFARQFGPFDAETVPETVPVELRGIVK